MRAQGQKHFLRNPMGRTKATDWLVLIALVIAPGLADHELHRVLLITADVAVAHQEQLQRVFAHLHVAQEQDRGWGAHSRQRTPCIQGTSVAIDHSSLIEDGA